MRESQPVKRSCGVSMIFDGHFYSYLFFFPFGFSFFENLKSQGVRVYVSITLNKNFHREKLFSNRTYTK